MTTADDTTQDEELDRVRGQIAKAHELLLLAVHPADRWSPDHPVVLAKAILRDELYRTARTETPPASEKGGG